MKHFFSIVIQHEYDGADLPAGNLSVIPANSQTNLALQRNNRIWFRSAMGTIDCFIEEDGSIIEDIDQLYFWVICTNDDFYYYSAYPAETSFLDPIFFWTNSGGSEAELIGNTIDDLINTEQFQLFFLMEDADHPQVHSAGTAPVNAIGCIAIALKEIGDETEYTIQFEVRKTIWRYHIYPNETQLNWLYEIKDEDGNWEFRQVESTQTNALLFQSTEPIAFHKKAQDKLKLEWKPQEDQRFEQERSMNLPYANYANKLLASDQIEYTPVYIHI